MDHLQPLPAHLIELRGTMLGPLLLFGLLMVVTLSWSGAILQAMLNYHGLAGSVSLRTATVHLGRGNTHLHRILTALADAKAEGELPLKLVIQDLLPYIPSGSPIILFSALDNDDTLPDAFTLALTRGYALTVVSPSSLELEAGLGRFAPRPGTSPEVRAKLALAQEMARIERDNTITELRSWGVHLGDWKPGDPVNLALAGVQR